MTTIKQFKDLAAVNRSIASLNNATKVDNLQSILVNIAYQAMHGNWKVESFLSLKDGNLSADFKKSLVLHMPVTYDKDAEKFVFASSKIKKILAKLGFETEDLPSFEEFANAYPAFNAVTAPKVAGATDNIDKLTKNLSTRLGKLELPSSANAEQIASIVKLLATSPSILANVSEMLGLSHLTLSEVVDNGEDA